MSTHDDFPDHLKEAARELRFANDDDVLFTRLQAGVMSRIRESQTVSATLAHWFRSVAAILVVVMTVGTASVFVITSESDDLGTASELVELQEEVFGVGD